MKEMYYYQSPTCSRQDDDNIIETFDLLLGIS